MPALVAGIHVLLFAEQKDVDGRNKSGHDVDVNECDFRNGSIRALLMCKAMLICKATLI
jgi:hypothetical protein